MQHLVLIVTILYGLDLLADLYCTLSTPHRVYMQARFAYGRVMLITSSPTRDSIYIMISLEIYRSLRHRDNENGQHTPACSRPFRCPFHPNICSRPSTHSSAPARAPSHHIPRPNVTGSTKTPLIVNRPRERERDQSQTPSQVAKVDIASELSPSPRLPSAVTVLLSSCVLSVAASPSIVADRYVVAGDRRPG